SSDLTVQQNYRPILIRSRRKAQISFQRAIEKSKIYRLLSPMYIRWNAKIRNLTKSRITSPSRRPNRYHSTTEPSGGTCIGSGNPLADCKIAKANMEVFLRTVAEVFQVAFVIVAGIGSIFQKFNPIRQIRHDMTKRPVYAIVLSVENAKRSPGLAFSEQIVCKPD